MSLLTLTALSSNFSAQIDSVIDSWSEIRAEPSSDTVSSTLYIAGNTIALGVGYTVIRCGLPFPTIPIGSKINSVSLSLYVRTVLGNDDATSITVSQGSYGLPATVDDYSKITFSVLGSRTIASLIPSQYNNFPLLSVPQNLSKLYLSTALDINNVGPTVGTNQIQIEAFGDAHPPLLLVNVSRIGYSRNAPNSMMMTGRGV